MNNIIQTIRHAARAAAVLLIALLAAQTAGAQEDIPEVSNASGLEAAFQNTDVSEINVKADITGVGDLQPLNRDFTINLNGHTISSDRLHFDVNLGCSLTINGEGQGGSVGNIIRGKSEWRAMDNVGTVTLSNVNITTNYAYAIFGPGTLYIGNNVSFNGWTQAPFNTPNVNNTGNYNYAPDNTLANVVATVTVGGETHYFENSGAALTYIVSHPDNDHLSLSGTTYTIHTATGWDYFCDLLASNAQGFFTGKTVRLGADIGTADDPVTSMASTAYHDFTGTFDGDGHTLTVGYGTADAPFGEQYAAPFRYLQDGCTIKNLHVAGHIYTSAKNAGGLAGSQNGDVTIQYCRSSVTIHSSVENQNNDDTHGGFIAYFGGQHKHLSFEGCLFDGKLLTTNGISHCGGFVGWANGVSNTTDTEVTFTNSLYAPAANVGCNNADVNNVNNPNGAVCINTLALTARQAPDGNYWTTYYNSALGFTIDADENACAYTATYGGNKLTLKKLGKQIPAGTAVIIVADNDVVNMATATDLDDFSGTNDLRGVDDDTYVDDITSDLGDGTLYVLGMTTVDNEQHFGFHRYMGWTMAAHKAFVLVDSQQAPARSLTMVFDEATGIESLTPDAAPKAQAAEHWFTLDGRRLQAKPTAPGIYINNGKKVVIK